MPDLCPQETPPILHASPFITIRGRLYYRRQGFVPKAQLTCPLGHRVKKRAIIHRSGAFWCDSKVSAHDECGAMVYVLVFPGLGSEQFLYAADVEHEDMLTMDRYRMDVADMLKFLGATMPQMALLRSG